MVQIEDLLIIKELGKGLVGKVFLCQKKGKNQFFAVKRIQRNIVDSQKKTISYLNNEIYILKNLNHPNIVKLIDFKYNREYYFIIMEFINGGELAQCLKEYQLKYRKPFSEEIVQYLMKQIVSAIKYIHDKNIIHRDLKLENIMVNFDTDIDKKNLNMMKTTIKIIDFGFSTIASKGNLAYTAIGTIKNMDPLILNNFLNKNKKGYNKEVDIWSLGTLCYEMLIGKEAFNYKSMDDLIKAIENNNYQIPTTLSKEIVSFLNGMLQYDGIIRLTSAQLVNHPFLKKSVKDFTKINLGKVSNKIINNQLNINSKKNKTIWAIFNQQDEQKLININSNNDDNYDIPITEENNNYQKLKTIHHQNIYENNNIKPENDETKKLNSKNKYMFGKCKSFYGQKMFLKDDTQSNNNNNTLENIEKNWLDQQQMINYPIYNLPKPNQNDSNFVPISHASTFNSEQNLDVSNIGNNHKQKSYYNNDDAKRSGCGFQ